MSFRLLVAMAPPTFRTPMPNHSGVASFVTICSSASAVRSSREFLGFLAIFSIVARSVLAWRFDFSVSFRSVTMAHSFLRRSIFAILASTNDLAVATFFFSFVSLCFIVGRSAHVLVDVAEVVEKLAACAVLRLRGVTGNTGQRVVGEAFAVDG